MEGQRITEDGNRRISQGNLIRITEDFIRTWPLTATSVSLSTTATTTITSVDVILVSGSSSLSTSATNATILIEYDKDVVAIPVELITSDSNATVIVDIDKVIAATNGALNLSLTNTSIVIVKDVELTIIPGHLELNILSSTTFVDKTLLENDSRLYLNFIKLYDASAINPVNDTIKLVLVNPDYVFDFEHVNLSEVSSYTVGDSKQLGAGKTFTDGVLDYTPKTIPFRNFTGIVGGFILYKDTGNESTSPLISYHKADFKGKTINLIKNDLEWKLNTQGFFQTIPEEIYQGRILTYTNVRTETKDTAQRK
jgi:hypothetical protein